LHISSHQPLHLADFPPVVVEAMWRGRISPVALAFLDELKRGAHKLMEAALAPK